MHASPTVQESEAEDRKCLMDLTKRMRARGEQRAKHDRRLHHREQRDAIRTRPRPRGAGRPKATATRSSDRSDDSGDDDDPVAPPAAIEAVAFAWMDTLRRRHPAMSWDVV
jgi:hypothetical protein